MGAGAGETLPPLPPDIPPPPPPLIIPTPETEPEPEPEPDGVLMMPLLG